MITRVWRWLTVDPEVEDVRRIAAKLVKIEGRIRRLESRLAALADQVARSASSEVVEERLRRLETARPWKEDR